MGNITEKLSNNFAHARTVSSRPNCLGLVKEARYKCVSIAQLLLITKLKILFELVFRLEKLQAALLRWQG